MEGTPTMDDVRSAEFDLVVSKMKEVWEAGLPVPEVLLFDAVAARTAQVAKRAKDFTFRSLGQFKCLAGGPTDDGGTHSPYVDLPHDTPFLDERGFFLELEARRVAPSGKGGPIAEDDVSTDSLPGEIMIAGITPSLLPAAYVVYAVGYVMANAMSERAVYAVRKELYEDPSALCRDYPEVEPMTLLHLMAESFGEISQRHRRLSDQAGRISSGMNSQDVNIERLLWGAPPQNGAGKSHA